MLKVYKKVGKTRKTPQTGGIDLFYESDKIRICQVLIFTCRGTNYYIKIKQFVFCVIVEYSENTRGTYEIQKKNLKIAKRDRE